jgi:hypothetical protein
MDRLGKLTEMVLERMFPNAEQEAIRILLLEECNGKLSLADENGYERIHLAILKISNGDMKKIADAVDLARIDWRDALMWAEFADDLDAHKKWARKLCSFCEG